MDVEQTLVNADWAVRGVMQQINRSGQGIAVVVDGQRRPVATVTDGDIRRAILGGIGLDQPLSELLSQRGPGPRKKPVIAKQGTQETELLKVMADLSIRHIPIVDASGRIVDMAVLSELIREYDLPMKAVVMAGGYGTRLRPLTEDLPKPMLPVGNRPLLELIIEQLCKAGIKEVNLTTHYKKDLIVEHFGDGGDFGVEINYVEEDRPLGTAGSLGLLENWGQPLLVINGDILTRVDFRAMLHFHREHGADMTVAVRQHEVHIPYGVVEVHGTNIARLSEKPTIRHLIIAGIYLLNPEITRFVPSGRPYDMTDLIARVLDEGLRVVSFPVGEYWLDIGVHDDYDKAQVDAGAGELV